MNCGQINYLALFLCASGFLQDQLTNTLLYKMQDQGLPLVLIFNLDQFAYGNWSIPNIYSTLKNPDKQYSRKLVLVCVFDTQIFVMVSYIRKYTPWYRELFIWDTARLRICLLETKLMQVHKLYLKLLSYIQYFDRLPH